VYVCMYVFMYAGMHVCMHVCTYVNRVLPNQDCAIDVESMSTRGCGCVVLDVDVMLCYGVATVSRID